jgi:hypothetical protein
LRARASSLKAGLPSKPYSTSATTRPFIAPTNEPLVSLFAKS